MNEKVQMNPKLEILIPVVKGLSKILGKDYEVNLHDVSMPEHSLVLCENGYVTGRMPGGPMTDFGLYMLQAEEYKNRDGVFNYLARNNRGEMIKCSAIFIRDEHKKVIGFLCVNYDISKAAAAQELIGSLLHLDMDDVKQYPESEQNKTQTDAPHFPTPVREWFAKDLEEVVSNTLEQIKQRINTPLRTLSKPEKKKIIEELHDRGFFLLKGAVDIAAEEMGNTKYTIYSYIRDVQRAREGVLSAGKRLQKKW